VTPVNDAPAAKDGSYTTNEDTSANVVLGASDVEGDALTYSIVGGPAHGKVTGSGANRTYTPDPDYNGPDSFTFRASDGTADSNVATVNISVKAVNDAPAVMVLAGSASQSACLGDTSGRITLKLSDVDSNLSDLKPSVASSSDTKLVPKSNVIFGGSGGTRTATISTVPGRTGTSTVTITVSDGQASSSVPVTVKAGGNGNDTLGGTSGADLLLGQNGDDTLSGSGASDVLCGNNGNDKLSGGTGSDTLDGGPGTDTAPDYGATEGDSRTNIP
jgi:large repetitive protein